MEEGAEEVVEGVAEVVDAAVKVIKIATMVVSTDKPGETTEVTTTTIEVKVAEVEDTSLAAIKAGVIRGAGAGTTLDQQVTHLLMHRENKSCVSNE